MESVIERIEKGHFWKFHGGIHPPEQKFLTSDKPIRNLPLPKQLILPLQQHIGQAGELLVAIGDNVLKGQALTKSSHPMAVPIHAPTSGKIIDIKNAVIAHPSGLSETCLFLEPDGNDQWKKRHICFDFTQLSDHDIVAKIADAGIAGMGGAGFPTHVKVNSPANIDFLIINAAECEPYITADDLLIREHCATIIDGIKILNQLLSPTHILIGIEDNKPEAIKTLQQASKSISHIKVCVLPTKYPSGGEKQLIQILTGKEIPSGTLPSHQGIVMQNVATCYAIADAVINDAPLIKRVVTVSGQGLTKPQNVWALLGSPVGYLLSQCGYQNSQYKQIIMGGPMMGFALPTDQVPIVKTSNCILAPSEEEISSETKEVECIRCGQCADVCPAQLLPQELQWSAKAKDQQQLSKLNLFDCIECGACAYVCPSQIPLVHYYRIAKAEMRQQQQHDITAEKAKVRFEARKARLDRDKKAREEKHKQAAAARKARMNAGTPTANTEKSAVAAALARVKAKKAQTDQTNNPSSSVENNIALDDVTIGKENTENISPEHISQDKSDKQNQVAAAIARAKAKKLAKTESSSLAENMRSKDSDQPAPLENENKQSKIAAAVAKAKAKKLEEKERAVIPEVITTELSNDTEEDANTSDSTDNITGNITDNITENNDSHTGQLDNTNNAKLKPVDDKKAKVAAAIAKAKARKIASQTAPIDHHESIAEPKNNNEQPLAKADDKKAKIAAAVAKAKARKLANETTEPSVPVEHTQSSIKTAEIEKPVDDKKSRVAAAVAKAKAKKLTAQQEKSESK
ncbi:MAG: electron transport complex protein RnfC [Alteromonadaceae bacterium]